MAGSLVNLGSSDIKQWVNHTVFAAYSGIMSSVYSIFIALMGAKVGCLNLSLFSKSC